jgi:hypothetical protein
MPMIRDLSEAYVEFCVKLALFKYAMEEGWAVVHNR